MPRRRQHIQAVPAGVEQAPAALVHRIRLGAPLHQGRPVHRLVIDVHAKPLQQIGRDIRQRLGAGDVGRRQQHDCLARVTGRRQLGLHLRQIARAGQRRHPGIARHRRVRAEIPGAVAPQAGIGADHARHVVGLRDGADQRAANRRVVERFRQLVEAHRRNQPGLDGVSHMQLRVLAQRRQQVRVRRQPPVDLAPQQRRRDGARVRDQLPFHAIEMHHLRSGRALRRTALARHVAGEPLIDHARAGDTLVGDVTKRPAADHLRHLLERIGGGEPLRHDRAHAGRRLRQRIGQQRKRPLEPKHQRAVIRRGDLVRRRHQRLPESVASAPAPHARRRIARQHLRAVMEHQARAQRDPPRLAVILGGDTFGHLRLRRERVIQAEQRVEHHEAVIARLIRGGPNRIEHAQIGLRHDLQHLGGFATRDRRHRQGRGGAGQKGAAPRVHRPSRTNGNSGSMVRSCASGAGIPGGGVMPIRSCQNVGRPSGAVPKRS